MAKQRYSLTRALDNIETQNAPKVEEHHGLVRGNNDWKNKFNIGSVGLRPGCREICVPWDKLSLTRDLSTQTQASGGYTVGESVPIVQQSLKPTSLMMRLPITCISGLQSELVLPRISTGVSPASGSEIQSL